MAKPNITFGELNDLCGPGDKCEIYSDVPNPGPDDKLHWRVRVPGRGVYVGDAEKDESNVYLADPHTFIPEN
jgi:hypothetical protein